MFLTFCRGEWIKHLTPFPVGELFIWWSLILTTHFSKWPSNSPALLGSVNCRNKEMVGWEKKDRLKIGLYTFLFRVRDLELLWVVEIGFLYLVESRRTNQMFFSCYLLYFVCHYHPSATVLMRAVCARWHTNMKMVRFPASKRFASAVPNLTGPCTYTFFHRRICRPVEFRRPPRR